MKFILYTGNPHENTMSNKDFTRSREIYLPGVGNAYEVSFFHLSFCLFALNVSMLRDRLTKPFILNGIFVHRVYLTILYHFHLNTCT